MKMRMTEAGRKVLMDVRLQERRTAPKALPSKDIIVEELNRPLQKGYILISRNTADWIMEYLLRCAIAERENY